MKCVCASAWDIAANRKLTYMVVAVIIVVVIVIIVASATPHISLGLVICTFHCSEISPLGHENRLVVNRQANFFWLRRIFFSGKTDSPIFFGPPTATKTNVGPQLKFGGSVSAMTSKIGPRWTSEQWPAAATPVRVRTLKSSTFGPGQC